jgi:acetyl esterase/lipase
VPHGVVVVARALMADAAVEYRLLQHAPCPGAIQDAAAVYSHILLDRLGATPGPDGKYAFPEDKPPGAKVVLIGDSAGGNLVLGLARWVRDEGLLPPPSGLLLLSPSADPSHAFPHTPSSYVPRPHADADYLVDTPEPRALLQRAFLGHHPLGTVHSPYISPASPRVLRASLFGRFPRTLVLVGDAERLEREVRLFSPAYVWGGG